MIKLKFFKKDRNYFVDAYASMLVKKYIEIIQVLIYAVSFFQMQMSIKFIFPIKINITDVLIPLYDAFQLSKLLIPLPKADNGFLLFSSNHLSSISLV